MMKSSLVILPLAAAVLGLAQQSDILVKLTGGERPAIAIPDFRGSGDAQKHMETFNRTLWDEVQASGLFKMAPKSMYPLQAPQQPQEFKAPLPAPARPARRGAPPPQPVRQGPWLSDWSGPPVNANYLAFGYTAIQGDQLVLSGWLYDVTQQDISNAQVIGKRYLGSIDQAGARKVAQEFAADILARFGGKSLMGSRIFFVSTRSGNKEIWSMDYDGSNQKQLTFYKTVSTFPAVAPDGSKFAFTSYLGGRPAILIHSVETGRNLRFYNQAASMNAASDFTPDGQQVVLSSTAGNLRFAQLFIANVDGSSLRRLSNSQAIEVEPKVNPKTGRELVFVSGRSGLPQIYRMNMDGADVTRLTTGEGEAVNPAWHPDGQYIAFAWTRGFEPGNYNIFVMDVATRQVSQLTHGMGRNENPTWAPDGRHIVFSSNRDGGQQIWTMLADGTGLKKLTTLGRNEKPVWSRQ